MSRLGSAFLFSTILIFAISPFVNAAITDFNCTDDKDGGIVMGQGTLTPIELGVYDLRIGGVQNFAPAHVVGDFTTDTPADPIVRLIQDVQNDTGFAWTGYQIAIGMNKSFSILQTGLMAPDGWSWSIVDPVANQPLPGDISPGLGWVGTVNFFKGPTGAAVAVDDIGTFGFKVSFLGSVQFYTAQTPTPEPTSIALLGLGAISILRRRRVR